MAKQKLEEKLKEQKKIISELRAENYQLLNEKQQNLEKIM